MARRYVKYLLNTLLVTVIASLLASCSSMAPSGVQGGIAPFPPQPKQIALLVPLHGRYAGAGKAIRNGVLAAYYQATQNGQDVNVRIYDTTKVDSISKLYRAAVANGAQLVIGPLTKPRVSALAQSSISVPVLALNYLPASQTAPKGFYQFGISPQNEAMLTADKAWKANLHNAILIYPDSAWGKSIADAFSTPWQQFGGNVVAQLAYKPGEKLRPVIRDLMQINESEARAYRLNLVLQQKANYVPQRRKDVDVIFLVAPPQVAREIMPLLRFYYAGNLPTYSISNIYGGIPNESYYRDLDGVIFCDMPLVLSNDSAMKATRDHLKQLWKSSFNQYIRLYGLGNDAFLLSHEMNQITMTPGNTISGVTGQLYIAPNHAVLRQLPWAQFRSGEPRLIS